MSVDAKLIWSNCLSFIRDNIDAEPFDTWFRPIIPLALLNRNTLQLQVPTRFFYEYIENHYISLIRSALTKELGSGARLAYLIKETSTHFETIPSTKRVELPKQYVDTPKHMRADILNPFAIPGIERMEVDPQLNPNYNFDSFIEGECNRLARSAGMAVANKPGTTFNPLFIFGGVGLGKTHLAHAIGREIKEKFPQKKVLCVTAEYFTKQYTDAATKLNNKNDFIHFYQSMDVLIVDDVFFLQSKEKTQDTFFHVFNHLHSNGKQIIMTSDRAPIDMQNFDQRLLSRFKWGLEAELLAPNFDTRLAILKSKLEQNGIRMEDTVSAYIAEKVNSNIREIEGIINGLMAHSIFMKKEITIELAQEVINKLIRKDKKEISISHITQTVADHFNMTVETLLSSSRKNEIVQARHLAMFLSKELTKSSLANIGREIGNRNHATVLNSCKQAQNLADTDKIFRQHLTELKRILS